MNQKNDAFQCAQEAFDPILQQLGGKEFTAEYFRNRAKAERLNQAREAGITGDPRQKAIAMDTLISALDSAIKDAIAKAGLPMSQNHAKIIRDTAMTNFDRHQASTVACAARDLCQMIIKLHQAESPEQRPENICLTANEDRFVMIPNEQSDNPRAGILVRTSLSDEDLSKNLTTCMLDWLDANPDACIDTENGLTIGDIDTQIEARFTRKYGFEICCIDEHLTLTTDTNILPPNGQTETKAGDAE